MGTGIGEELPVASNNRITTGPTKEWEDMDSARSCLQRSMLPGLMEPLRNPGLSGFGEEETMETLERTQEMLKRVLGLNETVKTQNLKPLDEKMEGDYRKIAEAIEKFRAENGQKGTWQNLIAALGQQVV